MCGGNNRDRVLHDVTNQKNFTRNAEQEVEVQKNYVRQILRKMLLKLKAMANVKTLLQDDGQLLREHLGDSQARRILRVLYELEAAKSSSSSSSRFSFHMGSTPSSSVEFQEKDSLFSIIDAVMASRGLMEVLDPVRFTKKGRLNGAVLEFIGEMELFEEMVLEKLKLSGKEVREMDRELKAKFRGRSLVEYGIFDLKNYIYAEKDKFQADHDRAFETTTRLHDDIRRLEQKTAVDLEKLVLFSEVRMMRENNAGVDKLDHLAAEARETARICGDLLQDHVLTEKKMRADKLKVEAKLAGWVNKFDTDIGDKQAELEGLERKMQEEKEILEELQEKFNAQKYDYEALMKEKKEEEDMIQNDKYFKFLMNRAARRIQRAWRRYKERKSLRKKARKSKGKKGEGKTGSAGPKGKKK